MLITVVDSRPLAVAVVLPALGSWWDFSRGWWAPGPPAAASLSAMKPVPGAVAPYDAVKWASLPEECRRADAVPLIVLVDATGKPQEVLDWSALAATASAGPQQSCPGMCR